MKPPPQRRGVLWYGKALSSAQVRQFRDRELQLIRVEEGTSLEDLLPSGRALVVWYDREKPAGARRVLHAWAARAVNHGLLVVTLASDPTSERDAEDFLNRLPPPEMRPGSVEVQHIGVANLAEKIARRDPGPLYQPDVLLEVLAPEGKRTLEAGDEDLDDTTTFLLRRAFADCSRVLIRKLTGGFSAIALEVHAQFRDGSRPLPFFAKVDEPDKILAERDKYRELEGYVPFTHRPRLDEARICVGWSRGVLVGDFVERSEPLIDVLHRGAGYGPLHSLFQDALRGWHRQAFLGDKPQFQSLFVGLEKCFDPAKMSRKRSTRIEAARRLGICRAPEQILGRLKTLPPVHHRRCTIHGDFHVGNVRVRGQDAILIDFQSVREGPLLADIAALEVSIVFQSYGVPQAWLRGADVDWPSLRDGWWSLVERLYSSEYFNRAPDPAIEPTSREWLWATVRELRLLALGAQTTPGEYEVLVAIHLLHRAMVADANDASGEFRYVLAYRLANELLDRSPLVGAGPEPRSE